MFGTFQQELDEEKVIYGLTANIKTYNPLRIAFPEWGALFSDLINSKTSLLNRLKYFTKPPGWKHDGTEILSEDLLEEWKKKKSTNL